MVQTAILQSYITKIRRNFDLLESLTVDRRVKIGWINIIGNALHTVFGIMDSSDKEYYSEIITQLLAPHFESRWFPGNSVIRTV